MVRQSSVHRYEDMVDRTEWNRMNTKITLEELYAEYIKIGLVDDNTSEFKTVCELSEVWGVSEHRVRKVLKDYKNKKRLIYSRIMSEGIDGRKTTTPVYKILPDQTKPQSKSPKRQSGRHKS